MSVIAAFASFSSLAFLLGFVGNGVITVMINSRWQADDDADNQSGDNRGDSAHTSISLTVPPASLNLQSASALYWTDHNQRPKPRYCCNGRLPDGYHQRSIIGKAPRSLICCNATASLTFRRSLSGQAACGRHPTNGKEAGSVNWLVDLSFGLAYVFARVIGVISNSSPPTMTSCPWFLAFDVR